MTPPTRRTTPEGAAAITISKTGGKDFRPERPNPSRCTRPARNWNARKTQPRWTTEGDAVGAPPQYAAPGRSCPTVAHADVPTPASEHRRVTF